MSQVSSQTDVLNGLLQFCETKEDRDTVYHELLKSCKSQKARSLFLKEIARSESSIASNDFVQNDVDCDSLSDISDNTTDFKQTSKSSRLYNGNLINIAIATEEQLLKFFKPKKILIGEARVAGLIRYREKLGGFKSMREIMRIPAGYGIGEKTKEKFSQYCFIE